LLAYSGGADSTFLLKVARDVLGKKILAVTATSTLFPKEELIFAKKMAKTLGARHKIMKIAVLKNKKFTLNPVNRCYFCKKELFSHFKKIAKKFKLKFVLDGSNATDKKDFRPGSQAKRELRIRSPLQEAGIGKEDVRKLSKRLRLITWNKPALSCLASRVAYGIKITPRLLRGINILEVQLQHLGFKQVRLRHYNHLCRIEVFKDDLPAVIRKSSLILDRFKKFGYHFVTVDLEGYRCGSMNIAIKNQHAR